MRLQRVFLGIGALVLAVGIAAGVGFAAMRSASAAGDVQHGVGFTKGCASPTNIGQPYACSYTIQNTIDEAHDTLTIDGLNDTVHAAGGNTSSGNMFNQRQYEIGTFFPGFSTPPTCTGGVGTGTAADPFRSAPGNLLTSCTLPFGSRLNVQTSSFYTVQPLDFNLPGQSSPTPPN